MAKFMVYSTNTKTPGRKLVFDAAFVEKILPQCYPIFINLALCGSSAGDYCSSTYVFPCSTFRGTCVAVWYQSVIVFCTILDDVFKCMCISIININSNG